MLRFYSAIVFLILFFPAGINAQNSICEILLEEIGTDISSQNDEGIFTLSILSSPTENADIIYCPAGIERFSPNDVKKKFSFEWTVKYNNIYLENSEGIVFEGMNEHGFSASLMYLNNSRLAKKNKEFIPIAASLSVNFFIDHFKCIDTALLAVWDIRIFDDIGLACGWPFRIVLHDSTGATAYIEYINGKRQVYTPEAPTSIVEGPSYARLLTIKHIADSVAITNAERRYLAFEDAMMISTFPENLKELLAVYEGLPGFLFIIKKHSTRSFAVMRPGLRSVELQFDETEFIQGEERRSRLFD